LPIRPTCYIFYERNETPGEKAAMTFTYLGPDPVREQVDAILRRIAAGEVPAAIEVAQVDVKEEPGRRGLGGAILPGSPQSESAAQYLAGEMACLANTPGGGAIVLGVSDDGEKIGTELEGEWLRSRIWELTAHALTVRVDEVDLGNTRLLILMTSQAIEPIRYAGKIKWRVDDHCVEIDPTSWHTQHLRLTGVDWSAQPSGHTLSDISAVAVEYARRYLRADPDPAAQDLASATSEDLLRRLHLVDGNDRLTNAGSLLFVGTPVDGIDYIAREVPGGDSRHHIRNSRSLLEQLWEVDQASKSSNRIVHVPAGFARGQVRAIPDRAMREAIVNGVVHRDWLSPESTSVEHIGDVLTVNSPGGFIGGVSPANIITHPAVARYRSLAEAVAALKLAEREGVGVDRMVRDMLALGHQEPEISEIPGPYVRVTLIGGDPDPAMSQLLGMIIPPAASTDVDLVLLIDHLRRHGWVDAKTAGPVLQRSPRETRAAIDRLASTTINQQPVIVKVKGIVAGHADAFRLANGTRAMLGDRGNLNTPDGRMRLILSWAQARGRVSSTEIADLTKISAAYAGQLLTRLEKDGLLAGGRETKRGAGFYYTPVRDRA
jgi:ATP-dependent DNA helicase RecG